LIFKNYLDTSDFYKIIKPIFACSVFSKTTSFALDDLTHLKLLFLKFIIFTFFAVRF